MLRMWKLAAAMIALCAPFIAHAETLSGTTNGKDVGRLSQDGGVRLLSSFHMSFIGADHHIMTLGVIPNQPDKDEALISYLDNNSDDKFRYDVSFAPYAGPIYQNVAHKSGCHGSCTLQLAAPPDRAGQVFVIKGFSVNFIGTDHHIDELKIQERDGMLTVAWNDQNDDDMFAFNITYAYVPRSAFSAVSRMVGAVRRVGSGQMGPGTAVIRGFSFDFDSVDHHITDIGVAMPGDGSLNAHYSDQNGDDMFHYAVEYAILR